MKTTVRLIAILYFALSIAASVSGTGQEKSRDQKTIVPLGNNAFRVEVQRSSPATSETGRVPGAPAFNARRLDAQVNTLKKISAQHSLMKGRQSLLSRSGHASAARQVRGVPKRQHTTILGKPSRFLQNPAAGDAIAVSAASRPFVSNVLLDGKVKDTISVGDPFTLTFSFAPGYVSAVMNIYIDADSNGIVSAGDILLEGPMLLLDNEDNDDNATSGVYRITFTDTDFLSFIVSSLIFEVNDFQSVSSAELVVHQARTSSIVTLTTSPAMPWLVYEVSGLGKGGIFFLDSLGKGSFFVDRAQTSQINVSLFDITGTMNGYVPPSSVTVNVTSDTTRVQLKFTAATSFIEGYLKDQTNAGIRNVKVRTSGNNEQTLTRTDSTGHYKFGVAPGTYYISPDYTMMSGYLRNEYSASVSVNPNATTNADLFFYKANSTIAGKVTLNGTGIGGIEVFAGTDSVHNYVLSAGDGNYSMPVYKPATGSWSYYAGIYLYSNGYYDYTGERVGVSPGASNVNFEIKRVFGGLTGRITDSNTGKPIANASVTASGNQYRSASSNDSGYYRMSLLDGTYSVLVEADLYNDTTLATLVISGSPITRNFALHRQGSFSGKVVDEDGKPISDADIEAMDSLGNWLSDTYSDNLGAYAVGHLATSSYFASAQRLGYVPQWYNRAFVSDSAERIQVKYGFDTPNINFVLIRGGSISGTVVNKSGSPLANIEVIVFDTTFNERSGAMTDDSGHYKASGLLTGKYCVRTYNNYYVDQWYDGASSPDMAKKVPVVIKQNTPGINFVLSAGASISGTVKNKNNTPIASASVYVLDSTFSIIDNEYTSSSGSYTSPRLTPGKKLFMWASASGYATRWYDNVSTPDSATPIILQSEERRENVNFILPLPGSISGRVWDGAGGPISYAYVDVDDSSGTMVGYGYTDALGNYVVSSLSGGKYRVHAYTYNPSYMDQWFDHKSSLQLADLVPVVAEKETKNINFDLKVPPADSIVIMIELASIPDSIQFSRAAVADYYADYWLGACLDADGSDTSGTFGCEMEFALLHFKMPGDSPFFSSIINAASHEVIQWRGNTGYTIYTDLRVSIDPSNRNRFIISVPRNRPEFSNITTGTKYYVHSLYNTGTTYYDVSAVGHGAVPITDPMGDAAFSFMDILSASWSFKTVQSVRVENVIPVEFALEQNYPNPFNPSTTISFDIPRHTHVSLKVYNVLGQEVATLVDEMRQAGKYRENWNAAACASGVYFTAIKADGFVQTRKMLLVK